MAAITWYYSPAQSNGATVLIFNGNAGDRSSRAPLAAALTRAGFSVLLFDYPGYGRNPRQPTEPGVKSKVHASWCSDTASTARSSSHSNRLLMAT